MTTHPHLEGLIRKWRREAEDGKYDHPASLASSLLDQCAAELEAALAALPGGGVDDAKPGEQVVTLAKRIRFLENEYGSLRRVGELLDVDAGYLSRLKNGEKENPSDDVLRKLKLVRRIAYAALPAPSPHEADQ